MGDTPTEPSLSIDEFCTLERISAPTYHKLKRLGLGPREMRIGRIIRISPEARLDWHQEREKPTEEQRRVDEQLHERAMRISKKSVASPRHVSKRGGRAA
jgi:hypothetical protein